MTQNRLLLRHAKISSTDGDGETVILLSKDKTKAEISVWAEASGRDHFRMLLKDKETQHTAISDLILLAKRTRSYNCDRLI